MANVVIERMRFEHLDAVMETETKSFPTPWHRDTFIRDITNPAAYYIVLTVDNKLLGYAGMWILWGKGHITTIAVHPDYRGRKFGERLLVTLIDEAINRGLKKLNLEVRKSNHIAQCLYLKYGFKAVAIRRGYYFDNNEDAILMEIEDLRSEEFLNRFRQLKEQVVCHLVSTS